MVEEITLELKHPELIALFALFSFFFLLELRVMLNSPIAFGDEGFHSYVIRYMSTHKEYPVYNPIGDKLYRGGFHGPPFFHLLGASFGLLGYHELILKVFMPFMGTFVLGFTVFLFGKKLFDTRTAFIASIIAVTVPSMVTYSVLVYRDVVFTFIFTMFSLTLLLAVKTKERKYYLIAGILCSITLLTKTPGYVAPVLVGLVFLYTLAVEKKFFKLVKEFLPIGIIFILMTSTFFLRNLYYYKTPACNLPIFDKSHCNYDLGYKSRFKHEGRTHEVGTEVSMFKMGIINYLNFAYGEVWFVPLLFILGVFLFLLRKSKLDVLTLLIFVSFFPVFYITFPGRAEDTARFILPLVPIISLISANYLSKLYETIEKVKESSQWFVLVGLLFIDALVVSNLLPFNKLLKSIIVSGIIASTVYLMQLKKYRVAIMVSIGFVVLSVSMLNLSTKLYAARHFDASAGRYVGYKQFSPALIEACYWIKKNTEKNITLGAVIWGGATAYNCERNCGGGGPDVTYSNNLTLVLSLLKAQGVTHVFVQKFSISWTNEKLSELYPISWIEWMENNPDHFVKVYENGPSLEQCRQMGGCDGTILYEVNYTGVELIPVEDLLAGKF